MIVFGLTVGAATALALICLVEQFIQRKPKEPDLSQNQDEWDQARRF